MIVTLILSMKKMRIIITDRKSTKRKDTPILLLSLLMLLEKSSRLLLESLSLNLE